MLNSYEFSKVKKGCLPEEWKVDGVLDDLEKFLQINWEQRSIFYTDNQITTRQQFIDFDIKDGIKLQNYIGTIIYKGAQLNIFPKIFKDDEDDNDTKSLQVDELIDNLIFWLTYNDKLNFPFAAMKNELSDVNNLIELFITAYVHYVKSVIDKQRYFKYEDVNESGYFVKGRINFRDYAFNKFCNGKMHKVEYTHSSFIYDNLLNQIIKCTCLFLLNLTQQESNKLLLRTILMILGEVTVKNCSPYDCDRVYLSALNFNYQIILSMSKMFLINKISSNSMGNMEAFCFLFPAEVLFEGFIGGLMKCELKDSIKIKTQASDMYLAELVVDDNIIGKTFQLKQDILVEVNNNIFVLDTKYKLIASFKKVKENKKLKISDADMKQMAIYAAKRGAKKLFLVYPLCRNEEPESIKIRYDIILDGVDCGNKIPLEILKVPFALKGNMNKTKDLIIDILKKALL